MIASPPPPELPELAQLQARIQNIAPSVTLGQPQAPQMPTVNPLGNVRGVNPLLPQGGIPRPPAAPQVGGYSNPGFQIADTRAFSQGIAPGSLRGVPGVVKLAATQVGVPYVFGAENPDGSFDCSGLTSWAYGRMGVNLPHSAAQQQQTTAPVSQQDLKPGMLIFYNYGRLGAGIADHVSIYAGHGRTIGAQPSTSGVAMTPVDWGNVIGFGAVKGVNYGTPPAGPQKPQERPRSAPAPTTRRTAPKASYANKTARLGPDYLR